MSAHRDRRPRATVADLLTIPDDERFHELIDGEILPKEAATGEHGTTQAALTILLGGPFNRRPGGGGPGGWWFATEVEIRLGDDVCRPDLVGWRRERVPERPRGAPITVRPDWICEVLSTNRRNDLIRKKRIYHRHGVTHYWIVDPIDQTLSVHRWNHDGYTEILSAEGTERVRAEPFEAIELSLLGVFGDDDEG